MFTDVQMHKQNVVCAYNGILLSSKRELNTDAGYKLGES